MDDKENIFSEKFDSENVQTIKSNTKIKKQENKVSEKNISRRTAGIIGAFVVGAVILAIVYGANLIGGVEDFDPSQCQYGEFKGSTWINWNIQDFFVKRCMTEEEFKTLNQIQNIPEKNPSSESDDGDPFRDISGATDQVQVEKTKDIIGYYLVTTNDSWYGDYVDFRKLPNKLDKEGSMRIDFRCFTDEFQKTSTYFGTFRNNIQDNMKVEVYIKDKKVNEQTTNVNRAIILEGSCYE